MLLLWIIYVISVLCLLCFKTSLFIDALWIPAGKGLTSWLSFVMCYCVFVIDPCDIMGLCPLYYMCIHCCVLHYFSTGPYDVTASKSYCRWQYPFIFLDLIIIPSKMAINTRFLFSVKTFDALQFRFNSKKQLCWVPVSITDINHEFEYCLYLFTEPTL